jgi:transcriptional regulatory protein LevR
MNCFCSSRPRPLSKKFTVLLVHVVAATPKSALRYSSTFAIELVQASLKKHTRINPAKVLQLRHRFRNLEIDSRLEIGFEENLEISRYLHSQCTIIRVRYSDL